MYIANISFIPNNYMWTTNISFIADGLQADNGNTNNVCANRSAISMAAGGSLIIDFLIFLPKLELNS